MVRTFQLTKALSRMTVLENMRLGATGQGGESLCRALLRPFWSSQEKEITARAMDLLARFKLDAKAGDFAGSLSGGQRKLLEMARALMSEPEMVMLDEPMAGVNPALTQSLLGHVKDLREQGMTVLFVEHDMDMVRDISDWVIVMAQGTVVAEGAARRGDGQPGRHRRLPGRAPRRPPHRGGRAASSWPRRRRALEAERAEAEGLLMAASMNKGEAQIDRRAHEKGAEEALLRADELVAGYLPGVNILNGSDLYVGEGELVGIIGPNGAGKSTLLKALFGLVTVRSGTVTLRGQDITGLKANQLVARGVGFVPQTNNVFPSLTIEENLQMGVYQRPKTFKKQFDFVAGLFPALADRRSQRCGSLSGGERQMVAMGRALMMEPSVLLLDEPSAGLSPALQDEVFIRTRQINRAGVSVIMVEQNARRCLQIVDRGYVLDQGRNAYTGTGKSLANDPKVIELYLGTLAKA